MSTTVLMLSALWLGVGEPSTLPSDHAAKSKRVLKSCVPTPRAWEQKRIIEAFETAADISPWICLTDPIEWWQATGDGFEKSNTYQAQRWQNVLIRQNRLSVFIQMDAYKTPRTGTLASKLPRALGKGTFATPAVRQAYKTEALQRVRWYKAKFVALAMEINGYYEEQPDDFANFLSLYIETRQAIKKEFPKTVVFVTFQYEQLLGRFGQNPSHGKPKPRWELLEMFEPHVDAIGLSTYPLKSWSPLRFGDPADIPDDYYSQIADHTDKPIIFAELGWSSSERYGSSEETQARFLRRFAELTQDLDLLLVNHFFLYDSKGFGPIFDSMGLLDREGRPKPAYHVWKNLWRKKQR
jgi:hypothetical protein